MIRFILDTLPTLLQDFDHIMNCPQKVGQSNINHGNWFTKKNLKQKERQASAKGIENQSRTCFYKIREIRGAG